jgi:hypothetical protein
MTQYEALDRISSELNRNRKYGSFGTATLRVADHTGNVRRFDSDMISVSVEAESIFVSIRKDGNVLAERTFGVAVEPVVAFVESFEDTFEDDGELTPEMLAIQAKYFGN